MPLQNKFKGTIGGLYSLQKEKTMDIVKPIKERTQILQRLIRTPKEDVANMGRSKLSHAILHGRKKKQTDEQSF